MAEHRAAAGAVYDRGYRPYDGPRGGRPAARWALWRLSVRRALGLRRSWRQKVLPFGLLAIATVPAVVNVGVGYLTRDTPAEDFEFITYREYVGVSTALVLFVAVVAPDLLAPDRRNRALPLIFARPLEPVDYVLAKLGAVFFLVFAFGFLPHVVLFVGQMFVSSDGALTYLTDNAEVLWQVPLAVLVLALHYSALSVAVASFATRRVAGGVAILGLGFVTGAVSGTMVAVSEDEASWWGLLSAFDLPLYVRDVIFLGHLDPEGPLAGIAGAGVAAVAVQVAVLVACGAVLLRRYREVAL